MKFTALSKQISSGVPPGRCDEDCVRRLWWASLATLQEDLLLQGPSPLEGVWLAAPLPALYEPALLQHLAGWVWIPAGLEEMLPQSQPLLPVVGGQRLGTAPPARFQRLALRPQDGNDPLLVLITPRLQVAMLLDGPPQARRLVVRFEAEVITSALKGLDQRLSQDDPAAAIRLRQHLKALGPLHNDPGLGLRFWPLLAERLAAMAPSVTLQPVEPKGAAHPAGATTDDVAAELALLEALTHEVRTPLATIRTLIRSLLRRSDLPAVVRQRLEQIDGECSEQIDRFGLIFLAAELQRQPGRGQPLEASELASTDLSQLLRHLEGIWQRQLHRRDLKLTLSIAEDLPPVLSDPARLETMLGGLMDRFSRSLPAGSHVRLRLRPAGQRLKLQLSSDGPGQGASPTLEPQKEASQVGPVLSWNPTTGSLNLSRQATQLLFHRLGGRFTERGGTSLTVFFPLAERQR